MGRLKYYVRLALCYQRAGIIKFTQYPANAVIMLFSVVVREAAGLIGVLAIANVLGGIGGWNLYEICLLFSMCAIIEAIGQIFFDQVWEIATCVQKGRFDELLVRPAALWFQLMGQHTLYTSMLGIGVYTVLLVYALHGLGIGCSLKLILFMIEFLICGTMVNTGLYNIFNCINFWTVQGKDIAELVQVCREFVKYPLGAFPAVIGTVFTFVLPFGFVGYYPAAYLVGKEGNWVLWGMPLCALIVVGIAALIWNRGVRGYNSTGT